MVKSKNTKTELVIIASIPSMDKRTRLYKLKRVLEANNIHYIFWGWNRNEEDDVVPTNTRIIFSGRAKSKPILAVMYIYWMVVVGINVLLKGKHKFFYCLGFNTALPITCVSLFCRRLFLFDNPDNVPLSFRFPWFVRMIFVFMEKLIVWRASIHLVPSQCRWNGYSKNLRIIPNTPDSNIFQKAQSIAREKQYHPEEGYLTLYVNGKLTKERGVKHVITLCRKISSDKLRIIVAGDLISDESKELVALKRANYLGNLSNEEALALYWKSDITLTYYDPDIAINRLAEPNKWGDCIVTNTPFVVNSEVITAKPYMEADACFHIPFQDEISFVKLFENLINDKDSLKRKRENLLKFDVLAWDLEITSLLKQWLKY